MPETRDLKTTPTEFSLACRKCGTPVEYEEGDVEDGLIDCESCGTANLHPLDAGALALAAPSDRGEAAAVERSTTRRSKGAK
jgi:DNA-directed RNA polymerase subunit RPC12/RpoP